MQIVNGTRTARIFNAHPTGNGDLHCKVYGIASQKLCSLFTFEQGA